jgi:hypothetical protein
MTTVSKGTISTFQTTVPFSREAKRTLESRRILPSGNESVTLAALVTFARFSISMLYRTRFLALEGPWAVLLTDIVLSGQHVSQSTSGADKFEAHAHS